MTETPRERPLPAATKLLGWRLIEAKPDEGWIRVAFEAKPEFCNPTGAVQGGFLAAMLDDAMGAAVFMRARAYPVTIDLHVQYLGSARPGELIAEGRCIQVGKTIAFIEGSLVDPEGKLIARATASGRLVSPEKVAARRSE
ncbi:MAG: PaaI family thioesterase [Hyphomonadaceae bacterium]|nr:PaaI family thioesterase [Hyphomonadaceae bacterium]